jgi:hypothetical protein
MRGCFALWKWTRHLLALAFDYRMKAELVVSTVNMLPFSVPGMIWHSDQGSQYEAEQTRTAFICERAGSCATTSLSASTSPLQPSPAYRYLDLGRSLHLLALCRIAVKLALWRCPLPLPAGKGGAPAHRTGARTVAHCGDSPLK